VQSCARRNGEDRVPDTTSFQRRWAGLKPPLRPNHEVVETLRGLIAGKNALVFLLGVTPELSELGEKLVAVDFNAAMIERAWPGDNARRRVVLGDWREDWGTERGFTAAIGDGSLAALEFPDDHRRFFAHLTPLLAPGARLACRLYMKPDRCEPVAALHDQAMSGAGGGWSAFKWRLAMSVAEAHATPNIALKIVHDAFVACFPDRDALAQASGWSREEIGTIDFYRGAERRFTFMTEAEHRAMLPPAFPSPRFLPSGTYELAERCPFLVADYRP